MGEPAKPEPDTPERAGVADSRARGAAARLAAAGRAAWRTAVGLLGGRPPAGGTPLRRLGPLIGLILLVTVISIFNPKFLTPANVINILHNSSFVGMLALGMTFVIILGGIDLSVGSLVAFAGGLGIVVMNRVIGATDSELTGVLAGFAVTLAAGTAAGALNGVLITKGRVAPFIATLGGLAAYRSLALAMVEGGEFRSASMTAFAALGTGGIPVGFRLFGRGFLYSAYGQPLVLPWPVIVFFASAALAYVLLNRTRYGRYVYAIGGNERAAVYSAIRVDRVKIATYSLLGGLAGLAAMMNGSRMNSVSSGQTGSMWELDAIAAVVIGGTRMSGGSGSIWSTVVGLLMLGVIGNMLNLLQVSPYLQGLVKGLIIVTAVLMQRGGRAE